MSGANEYGDNEQSPLINNERSVITPNYEGVENRGTGTDVSDEPREYVSHQEYHAEPQTQRAMPYAVSELSETLRPTGPTVTCRVCSATIVIEGKVEKFSYFHLNSVKSFFVVFY